MKKTIAVFLILGFFIASGGMVRADSTIKIYANVQSSFKMELDSTSITFNHLQPGIASEDIQLTTTTTGSGSYQLILTSSNFTSNKGIQPAAALRFKEHNASIYRTASSEGQIMMAVAGAAKEAGDSQVFDLQAEFPVADSPVDAYTAVVTITCIPQ